MQVYTKTSNTTALSRTWETVTFDRMDGAVVQVRRHTVTISKMTGQHTAEIDGQPATVFQADSILRGANSRTVVHEILPVPAYLARMAVSA